MAAVKPSHLSQDDWKGIPPANVFSNEETTVETVKAKIKAISLSNEFEEIGSFKIRNIHISKQLTLADFRVTKGDALHEELIKRLDIQPSIDLANTYLDFYKRLESAATRILDQVPLYSLQRIMACPEKFQHSDIYIALTPPENITNIDVNQLSEFADPSFTDLELLARRLDDIVQNSPPFQQQIEQQPMQIPRFFGKPNITIAKLRSLSPEQLLKIAGKLPLPAFKLLTDAHFLNLDFSKLNRAQIINLFTDNVETMRQRLLWCTSDQFKIMIQKKAVGDNLLNHLPDEVLPRFPLDSLSAIAIETLFFSRIESPLRRKATIQSIPAAMIHSLVVKNLVDSLFLEYISSEQIAHLNPFHLTKDQQKAIMCSGTSQEQRQKIASLPSPIINQWLPEMDLEFFRLLSEEQLKDIDVSRLIKAQIEFLFPTLEIANFYPGVYLPPEPEPNAPHQWKEQHQSVHLSVTRSTESVQKELEDRKASCEKHLKLFSAEQIEAIKGSLPPEVLSLLID